MKTKFYIGYNHAESSRSFIVKLTDEEHEAVKKFVSAQNDSIIDAGYCGFFDISDESFTTRSEAINFIFERGY